jgi:hypothetical protein
MNKQTIYSVLLVLVVIATSCSNDDDTEPTIGNLKDVTDCEIAIETNTLASICVDGTDFALPNEIIKFVTTFYSKNDNPIDTEFIWTIESGNMEILNIENSTNGLIAKSIALIKFNTDFSGNGVIKGMAENNTGSGFATHSIELESN